ncbi:MAG: GNAT family N-acetyltransferase [Labedaea sp.]
MRDLEVRPARLADLEALVGALGQQQFFIDRLARQNSGRGILLTAWKGARAQGDVYLRLEPAEEPEIRMLLPGVPFLTHLEVVPRYQNRGIGTQLITAAERHLHRLGHDQVALAVEITNLDAARLYKRLGYTHWNHNPVVCYARLDDDRLSVRAEICDVLVKQLALPRPRGRR